MYGMMRAWDELIAIAQRLQRIGTHHLGMYSPDTEYDPNRKFDLITYGTTRVPPVSNLPKYLGKLRSACGCSDQQIEQTNQQVEKERIRIVETISDYDRFFPPTLFDRIYDILHSPGVLMPVPAPVPAPRLPAPTVPSRVVVPQ
jgi:hypothetical protein